MWRQVPVSFKPAAVSWLVMTQEIRSWVSICGYNSTIDAQACWYCYRMKEEHDHPYSKELGAAAAIFSLKLLSDSHFTTEAAVSKHGNRIIMEYERQISTIEFSTRAHQRPFSTMINNTYDRASMMPEQSNLVGDVIHSLITEDVWEQDKEDVVLKASREISRYIEFPEARARSYSL